MIAKLELVFAPKFEFHAYNPDGTEFGEVEGSYSPRTWLETNDAETVFGKARPLSGLLVPSYAHVLTVREPGRRVALDGYHAHDFLGAEVRAAVGATRHVAQETIVFE